MTRFARAQGSKASNERLPEEATSWEEMKQQLEESQKHKDNELKRNEANAMRLENYNKFLKENDSKQSKSWAEIPSAPQVITKESNISGSSGSVSKEPSEIVVKKGKRKRVKTKKAKSVNEEQEINTNAVDSIDAKKVGNSKIKHKLNASPVNDVEKNAEKQKFGAKKQKFDAQKQKLENESKETEVIKNNGTEVIENNGTDNKVSEKKPSKKNKVKPEAFKTKKTLEEMTESEKAKFLKSKEKKRKQWLNRQEKRKQLKAEKTNQMLAAKTNKLNATENVQTDEKLDQNPEAKTVPKQKNGPTTETTQKRKKKIPGFEAKRRKPLVDEEVINGVNVKIGYCNGYPVTAEDAERLEKLRREMISKGLPRQQVQAALKLERRRAEKALTRLRKQVCFSCRKFGHSIHDCPELTGQQGELATSGVCLKCGSTEHTYTQCRLVKSPEFKFATCFICKEQGHISRQCPDNARGLYPKGGACKLCGDVTHLRKDCPQTMMEKESNLITLDTINDPEAGVEDLEIKSASKKLSFGGNKAPKIVTI